MSRIYGWSEARSRGAGRLTPAMAVGTGDELDLIMLFDRLNAHHFGGTLPRVPVKRGLYRGDRTDPDVLAQCRTWIPFRAHSEVEVNIYMAEALMAGQATRESSRWLEISRCLLHEMVHFAVDLDRIGGRYADGIDGHDQEFANECNRIGRAMGWDHVVAAERAVTGDEDASWWHSEGGCETCTL